MPCLAAYVAEMGRCGSKDTVLIVLRGNSGSGKSTVARELRERYGRGLALVEQDYLRRIVLWEDNSAIAANNGLIEANVRFCLDSGYLVILDGILETQFYEPMLRRLHEDHLGATHHFYFDLPLAEIQRRHKGRKLASLIDDAVFDSWYVELDLLDGPEQNLIRSEESVDDIVDRIFAVTGLTELPRDQTRTPAPRHMAD